MILEKLYGFIPVLAPALDHNHNNNNNNNHNKGFHLLKKKKSIKNALLSIIDHDQKDNNDDDDDDRNRSNSKDRDQLVLSQSPTVVQRKKLLHYGLTEGNNATDLVFIRIGWIVLSSV